MIEEITLIVPAYNEEDSIKDITERSYNAIKNIKNFEILIIDDGSNDGTFNNIPKLQGVRVIKHKENLGYGQAIITGIKESTYENICIIDADGSYQPEDIIKLINEYKGCDMIVGVRKSSLIDDNPLRKIFRWLLKKLVKYLISMNVPDLNSGLRIFKKEIAKKFFYYLPKGFSFTTTLTILHYTHNYEIKYIDIDYKKRRGKSKIKPLNDIYNFLILVVRTVMYSEPLKIFLPMAIFCLSIGLIIIILEAILIFNITDTAMLFVLSGFQIAALGLLGDLIVRMRK